MTVPDPSVRTRNAKIRTETTNPGKNPDKIVRHDALNPIPAKIKPNDANLDAGIRANETDCLDGFLGGLQESQLVRTASGSGHPIR